MTDPRTILGQARQGPIPVNWRVFTKKRGKLSYGRNLWVSPWHESAAYLPP
jgi:hypothetical protein